MDADKRLAEYKKLNQYMESIDEEAVASSSTSVNSQNATSFFKENKQLAGMNVQGLFLLVRF